jgi:hypothetical protein
VHLSKPIDLYDSTDRLTNLFSDGRIGGGVIAFATVLCIMDSHRTNGQKTRLTYTTHIRVLVRIDLQTKYLIYSSTSSSIVALLSLAAFVFLAGDFEDEAGRCNVRGTTNTIPSARDRMLNCDRPYLPLLAISPTSPSLLGSVCCSAPDSTSSS